MELAPIADESSVKISREQAINIASQTQNMDEMTFESALLVSYTSESVRSDPNVTLGSMDGRDRPVWALSFKAPHAFDPVVGPHSYKVAADHNLVLIDANTGEFVEGEATE
jgi:hypothetical protein